VLFFRKNEDWADEAEYRWVLRSPEPAPAFASIKDSLCGIVIGEGFPSSDRDSLRYLATGFSDPPIAACLWKNGFPHIVPTASGGEGPIISLSGIRFWTKGANPASPPPSMKVPRQDPASPGLDET
jgi:hypothetical protein